ncbi:MAG: DNA polymerase III subunit beta [Parcubacteria group bacterium]|nr:DNA polymerase III subunit beta [Parcubacteria group bacterium]
MRIECVKEKIKNAVSIAEKVTGKNLTLPILSSLLFVAKGQMVRIRATNLDLGVEIIVPAKVEEEGVTAIPGGVLNNLLSNMHDKTVSLKLKNNNLSVSTKNISTVIKSYPYEDFPTLPHIKNKNPFIIDSHKFVSGLKSVSHSASLSDIKPEISSVYIFGDSDTVTLVATDSFRLAEKKLSVSHGEQFSPVLIPLKNILEIIRILDEVSGDVEVHFDKNQISFVTENMYITSRIIDGVFPDYQQIIPKEFKSEATILKEDMINALKISNIFSDKLNQVDFSVDPKGKEFTVHSQNADVGEHVANIEGALSGEKLSLSFNQRYLIECFASIPKDSVVFQFSGEARPLVIRGVGDKSFMYLVMPLNK